MRLLLAENSLGFRETESAFSVHWKTAVYTVYLDTVRSL